MHRYITWNSAMATTAIQPRIGSGTAIKTMLQLATPATRQIQLIAWGYSTSPSDGGTIELIETDVAATVTAHVASGVQPLVPGQPASLLTLGASATGYTATAEGTPTATRTFDAQVLTTSSAGNNVAYSYQWMPDERPIVAVSKFLRVRADMVAGADIACWVVFEE